MRNTNKNQRKFFKLSELSKPFVIQNNKCSGCNLKLDFPVIHFKCKHSFHQKCLSTNLIATSTESLTLSTPTSSSTSMLNPNNNAVINHNDDDKFTCPICIHKFNDIKNAKLNQYKLEMLLIRIKRILMFSLIHCILVMINLNLFLIILVKV